MQYTIDIIAKYCMLYLFTIAIACNIDIAYNMTVRWRRTTLFHAPGGKGSSMDEKKSSYRGYTQVQNKATQKYIKQHLENIQLRVPKGRKDYYKDAAAAAGLSLNQFAVSAMDEKIARDNTP